MGMGNYILNAAGEPELCEDVVVWAKWFEAASTRRQLKWEEVSASVRLSTVPPERTSEHAADVAALTLSGARAIVSTVFLGIDHSHAAPGPPIIWETSVFASSDRGEVYGDRYSTQEEALEGHERGVEFAQKWCREHAG